MEGLSVSLRPVVYITYAFVKYINTISTFRFPKTKGNPILCSWQCIIDNSQFNLVSLLWPSQRICPHFLFIISASHTVDVKEVGQSCCWDFHQQDVTTMIGDVEQIWAKWSADTGLFPGDGTLLVQVVATSVVRCAMICYSTPGCQRFYINENMSVSDARCTMTLI